MDEYQNYDALGLAELVRKGDVSAGELLGEAVGRAEAAQKELNCFSAMFPDYAENQISDGLPDGPFAGVPMAVKDLGFEIKGQPITNGSQAFKGHVAAHDSVMCERYKAAGFTLFGQTTSPEFGLTTTTESTLYGQTRNPWDTTRTSGGSSGGASATVASGVIPLAHASDGGGSIRIPAGCTGLFGMKPSRGRMPMGPLTTEGWNGQSTHHAVSRSVRDNAALLDATHGLEIGSRYDAPAETRSFMSALESDPKPLKIALWDTAPNGTKPDADAAAGLASTAKLLESLGHKVEVAGPEFDGEALGKGLLATVSAAIAMVMEARGEVLGRTLGPDDMEPITARFVEMGNSMPMKELMKATQSSITAGLIYDRFLVEGGYDMILSPTMARVPDKLGVLSLAPTSMDGYTEAVTSFAAWCAISNQAGSPAMSVPLHWTEESLPIGMMFGARCGREWELYQLAGQLERAAPWAHRRPPFWVG
ncbi:MAG: amidase [Hyphomonadaceae bacterium]|nr:amidase [Hyphomonadaceae bacterium]